MTIRVIRRMEDAERAAGLYFVMNWIELFAGTKTTKEGKCQELIVTITHNPPNRGIFLSLSKLWTDFFTTAKSTKINKKNQNHQSIKLSVC